MVPRRRQDRLLEGLHGYVAGGFRSCRGTADGGKETRLTHTDSMETGAAWSPSGKSILFEREAHLFKLRLRDRKVTPLGEGRYASWSPDGRRIVYSALGPKPSSGTDLYMARPNGSHKRRLT